MQQRLIVEPDVEHRPIMAKIAEVWEIDAIWKRRTRSCG
jgi:hypothetical protein